MRFRISPFSNVMQGVGPQRQGQKRKGYAEAHHQRYQRRVEAMLNGDDRAADLRTHRSLEQGHARRFFRRAQYAKVQQCEHGGRKKQLEPETGRQRGLKPTGLIKPELQADRNQGQRSERVAQPL